MNNIQLACFTLYQQDRTDASDKTRGGGQCIFVNNSWCTNSNEVARFCPPEVELLMISCRPHYLAREFSFIFFVAAVYLPPQIDAGTKTHTQRAVYSHKQENKQENIHPEPALLVAGDFNAGKLKSVLPNFYQHVKCARGEKTLDQFYSTHRDTCKALPRPPFGKSDHNSILPIPAYNQKLKQKAPVTRSIKKSGQMRQMPSYRTVFIAKTGICSRILQITLRSTPHLSLASSISALMMLSPQ